MFKTDIDTAVCLIRDKISPPNNPRFENDVAIVKGMVFVLQLQLHEHKATRTHSTSQRRRVFVAIGGNTNVFIAIESETMIWNSVFAIPEKFWVNSCNHDSCWRTDGMRPLTNLYFELANMVNPDVAPDSLTDHSYIFDFFPVEIHHVRHPTENYHRVLKELIPIS